MRSTTVLNFLFATATIAAPILEGVLPVGIPDLPTSVPDLDLDSLTKAVPELPVRRTLAGLDLTKIVPVSTSDLPIDTSSVPLDTSSVPLDTSSLPLDTSSLPLDAASVPLNTSVVPDLSKRILGLDSTLKTVNSLLNDVLSLTDKVEADLLSLIGHLEDVDVQGVLNDVYTLLSQVVAKVHTILKAEDADINLSSVQPIVNTITKELNSLAAEVQQLLDAGVVGDLIVEIKSVLDDVIALVEKLTGDDLKA